MKKKSFIEITNISKSDQNGAYILDDISIDIEKGEIFSLLGSSGCGKTTFLRILSGLETPDSGNITIEGYNYTNTTANKRPVNMMFQNYALFPHMSIYDNIAFGLRQENISTKEINIRVNEMLEMLDLTKFALRFPEEISGGQKQRTALARSLAKRPKLLLLDEPLGSLDPKTRKKTQLELIKIQQELGVTFVIVTHELDEALCLSDRIGVMKEGKIIQIGSPQEIYHKPNSVYVANFIDYTNIITGAVIDKSGDVSTVYNGELDATFFCNNNTLFNINDQIWLSIRPEDFLLTDITENILDAHNYFTGKIIDISFMGSNTFYHVALANDTIIHISKNAKSRSKFNSYIIGKTVYVMWDYNAAVILKNE